MSLLDLIQNNAPSDGMNKTASEVQDLTEKGDQMYGVGHNMAIEHIKQAAEEAANGAKKPEDGDDKSKMSSDDRVKARTKEIFENMKKKKKEKE